VSLLCNPASGGTFSSTAIEIIKWVNFFAIERGLWRIEVGLTVHRYAPGGPGPTVESKKAEREKFDKIPKKALQNGMVQRMVERVHEIQDAE
jgi:hypothetical protein